MLRASLRPRSAFLPGASEASLAPGKDALQPSVLPAAARLPLAAGAGERAAAGPQRGKGGGFGRDPKRPKSREGRGEEGGGAGGGKRQRRAHALCRAVPYWNEAASGAPGSRSPRSGGGLEKLPVGEAGGGGVPRRAERVGPQVVGTFCLRSAGPAGFFRAPEVWMRGKKGGEGGGGGGGRRRRRKREEEEEEKRRQEAGAARRRGGSAGGAAPLRSRRGAMRGAARRATARAQLGALPLGAPSRGTPGTELRSPRPPCLASPRPDGPEGTLCAPRLRRSSPRARGGPEPTERLALAPLPFKMAVEGTFKRRSAPLRTPARPGRAPARVPPGGRRRRERRGHSRGFFPQRRRGARAPASCARPALRSAPFRSPRLRPLSCEAAAGSGRVGSRGCAAGRWAGRGGGRGRAVPCEFPNLGPRLRRERWK